MFDRIIKEELEEALKLQHDKANNELVVVSDLADERARSQETFRNKEILKKDKVFKWSDGAWRIDANQFQKAKEVLAIINKADIVVKDLEEVEEFVSASSDFSGKNNLMDKINMYVNDLANATDERALTAEIQRYLNFFAKFHKYSFTNRMLIYLQNPTATHVAGYNTWKNKFHRYVAEKGAGILVFAPMKLKSGDEDGNEEEINTSKPMYYRAVYVYDIKSTKPIDERGEVPEEPQWYTEQEATERTKTLYRLLTEVISDLGIELTDQESTKGERGWSKGEHINVTSTVQGAGEFATLVHELAHSLMHFPSGLYYQGDEIRKPQYSKLRELQAESVAYVVLQHFDLEAKHSVTYLALWKANKDTIKANLKAISDVSKFIIDKIDRMAQAEKISKE